MFAIRITVAQEHIRIFIIGKTTDKSLKPVLTLTIFSFIFLLQYKYVCIILMHIY